MEFSLLGFGFQFSVETQEFGVGDSLVVGGENGMQRGKNPSLPVDEGAVAIEGHEAELSEVQHELAGRKSEPRALCPGLYSCD